FGRIGRDRYHARHRGHTTRSGVIIRPELFAKIVDLVCEAPKKLCYHGMVSSVWGGRQVRRLADRSSRQRG
ncbi:MAG: hypothetical protein P8P84_22075, partial [Paracoccaceae bacterium]|nr:hypothetical protein [Paracoccaceae bacterium]